MDKKQQKEFLDEFLKIYDFDQLKHGGRKNCFHLSSFCSTSDKYSNNAYILVERKGVTDIIDFKILYLNVDFITHKSSFRFANDGIQYFAYPKW